MSIQKNIVNRVTKQISDHGSIDEQSYNKISFQEYMTASATNLIYTGSALLVSLGITLFINKDPRVINDFRINFFGYILKNGYFFKDTWFVLNFSIRESIKRFIIITIINTTGAICAIRTIYFNLKGIKYKNKNIALTNGKETVDTVKLETKLLNHNNKEKLR